MVMVQEMPDVCEQCDVELDGDWYSTECCGGVCPECYDGEVLYLNYAGDRAYSEKHSHGLCEICEEEGIHENRTVCRACKKKERLENKS